MLYSSNRKRLICLFAIIGLICVIFLVVYLANSQITDDIGGVRDEMELKRLSRINLVKESGFMFVSNSIVYVSTASEGLFAIDIHDERNPLLLDNIKLDGIAGRIWVDGVTAYVSAGKRGFYIVDVSNPSHLVLKQTVSVQGAVSDIIVISGYIYTASWDGGVYIFDKQNVTDQLSIRNIPIEGRSSILQLMNNTLFVGTTEGLLQLIDVKDPQNPLLRKSLKVSEEPNYLNSISVQADRVYIGLEEGWKKIDISDIDHMRIVDWYSDNNDPSLRTRYQIIAVDKSLIVSAAVHNLGSELKNILQIVRERSEGQPVVIDSQDIEEYIADFFVERDRVYIVTREGELQIFSVVLKSH